MCNGILMGKIVEEEKYCKDFICRYNPDFAFGCNHKCSMHLKVALSIALIVVMELFLNRSVQNLNLAAFKTDKISVPQRLRDGGFERIKFLLFLNANFGYNLHNLTNAQVYRLMKEDLWKNYSFSVG
jgi:hypothetical protein